MSLENFVALLISFGINAVALWGAFRKKRTEIKAADVQVDSAIEDGAIGRWQAFVGRLEAKIDSLEKSSEAMRVREIDCAAKTARQEVEIAHLNAAVKGLRADLKRAGIHPGSGNHEPLDSTQVT